MDRGSRYLSTGIAVDSQGYVYVADSENARIQKFDSDGMFVASWGSQGSGEGQFSQPADIAVDSQGYVYVADGGNNRIQVWAPSTLSQPETGERSTNGAATTSSTTRSDSA